MGKMVFLKGFDSRLQAHAWVRNMLYEDLKCIGIIIDDDILSRIMKNGKHRYKIIERIEVPSDMNSVEAGYGKYRIFLEA